MKKIFLLAIFHLLNLFLFAQSIGNEYSVWTFRRQRNNIFEPIVAHQVRFRSDTLLNGNLYRKFSIDNEPNSSFYLRNVNNKVYFFQNGSERVWFDFNLQVGDTLKYQVPALTQQFYDIMSGGDFSDSLFAYAIIDSIKIESFGGQQLKAFYTSAIDMNTFQNDMDWRLGKVVENIGGIDLGIFGTSQVQFLNGVGGGELSCYQDKNIQFQNMGVINCLQYVGLEEKQLKNSIQLSYTSDNKIRLTFPDNFPTHYKLSCFDVLGKSINFEENKISHTSLEMEFYAPQGIYYILLKAEETESIILKCIKM